MSYLIPSTIFAVYFLHIAYFGKQYVEVIIPEYHR